MRILTLLATVAALAAAPVAFASAQGQGKGHGQGGHQGKGHCPPGLANRSPACVPPGQARHYQRAQRLPADFTDYTAYNAIPVEYRRRYAIPTGQRYIYSNSLVYVVDPRTLTVQDIIDLVQ